MSSNAELESKLAGQGARMTPLAFEQQILGWYKTNGKRMATFAGGEERARQLMAGLFYAASRVPKLMSCTIASLGDCMMQSAQLGLFPGALGHCSYLPFANRKRGTLDATFVPGYQGLVELAYQGGGVKSIQTDVVYEADEFVFEKGTNKFLKHVPFIGPDKERGEKSAVYCVVETKTGINFEVKSIDWVQSIRKQSARGESADSPWNTHWDEMARKSIFKAASKWIPKNQQLAEAIALDNEYESGKRDEPIIAQGFTVTEQDPSPEPQKQPAKAPEQKPTLPPPQQESVVLPKSDADFVEKKARAQKATEAILGTTK